MERWSTLVLGLCLVGCGEEVPEEVEPHPDTPSLVAKAEETGALQVGAGVKSIIPACFESWIDDDGDEVFEDGEDFLDCGCDRLCPGDEGYPGADEGEGDEVFQMIWIGGFQNGRAATGVRSSEQGLMGEDDRLDARAVVLSRGELTVGVVTLDALGFMYDDTLAIRELAEGRGLELDHILVHSSHSHSAPDSMGLYGPTLFETGYDPQYAAQVHEAAVDALAEAKEGLEPVQVRFGEASANGVWDNGMANLISDLRDPVFIDPRVGAVSFEGNDGTVATLVHWANHPETVGSDNTLLSSGYVQMLRRSVSEGTVGVWREAEGREGLGGTTLFLNGAVGGMMSSLRAETVDPDGVEYADEADLWQKTDAIGAMVGELALDALTDGQLVEEIALAVGSERVEMPIDNTGFQLLFRGGVFDHRSVEGADDGDFDEARLASEMNVLKIGPITMVSWPGEVLPELLYEVDDTRFHPPGVPLIAEDNPNPPDLEAQGALEVQMEDFGGELNWVIGLGNDEVGYIIPKWQFELAEQGPYLQQAEGDHYEETNSLGPETADLLLPVHAQLSRWISDQ